MEIFHKETERKGTPDAGFDAYMIEAADTAFYQEEKKKKGKPETVKNSPGNRGKGEKKKSYPSPTKK